jgi:1,4-dihydroxy-2-naphthoate octaprenyltransferase
VIGGLVCQTVFLLGTKHEPALIGLIPAIILIIHVRKVMRTTNPKDFDPELKKVALSTFGIAVLSAVGLLIG